MFGNGNGDQSSTAHRPSTIPERPTSTWPTTVPGTFSMATSSSLLRTVQASSSAPEAIQATATLSSGHMIAAVGSGGFSRRHTFASPVRPKRQYSTKSFLHRNSRPRPSDRHRYSGETWSPRVQRSSSVGGTFNGTTDLTKTGASGDWGAGGNIYNGACSITNSGSSHSRDGKYQSG